MLLLSISVNHYQKLTNTSEENLDWTSIIIEVILFAGLGYAYYAYQKRKIIRRAKEDILYRINQLLEEIDHRLDTESINTLFQQGEYTAVSEQIKPLSNDEHMTKLINDLLEMNKFA